MSVNHVRLLSTALLLLFAASGCNSGRVKGVDADTFEQAEAVRQEEMPAPVKPVVMFDTSYVQKTLKVTVCTRNGEYNLLYFEDSILGQTCKLYLKSELSIVDSVGRPPDSILEQVDVQHAVLFVNGSEVKLLKPIKDAEMMLPTYIGLFNRAGKTFMLLKMNLISAMAGNYWYNLLLGIDKDGKVVAQYGVETNGEVTFDQLIKVVE